MKKRTIPIILMCFALVFALAACGSSSDSSSSDSSSSSKSSSDTGKVILDDNNVKITFYKLYEAPGVDNAVYIKWLVENKTDKRIMVTLTDAYVNNTQTQMLSGVPTEMDAGKQSKNAVFFTGYKKNQVTSLSFKVQLYDDDMNTIETSNSINVPLN